MGSRPRLALKHDFVKKNNLLWQSNLWLFQNINVPWPTTFGLRQHLSFETLTLKHQSRLRQTTNFVTSLLIFERNKEWYFMRIVCKQTILMKYHALFVILKMRQSLNCRLQQNIGDALWVKPDDDFLLIQSTSDSLLINLPNYDRLLLG